MNSDQEIIQSEKNSRKYSCQSPSQDGKQSVEGRMKFTNEQIAVRYAFSESINDVLDRSDIVESEILQRDRNEDSDEDEQSELIDSQNMKKSSMKSMKKSFGLKKKGSLNLPVLLNHFGSANFMKQIKQSSEKDQSVASQKIKSTHTPNKPVRIFKITQKTKENDSSDAGFKKNQNHQQETSKTNFLQSPFQPKSSEKMQKFNKNQSFENSEIQQQFQQSLTLTHYQKNKQLEVVHEPQQIPLPIEKQQSILDFNYDEMEVENFVPISNRSKTKFEQIKKSVKKVQTKNKQEINDISDKKSIEESIIIAHNLHQEVKNEEIDLTNRLINKIENLEYKIRILSTQKNEQEKKQENIYERNKQQNQQFKESTPNSSPQYGSIRRNQIKKKFTSSTSEQSSNLFRLRAMPRALMAANILTSNVFNIAVIEPKNVNEKDNEIRSELQMLKTKVDLLQNKQSFKQQPLLTQDQYLSPHRYTTNIKRAEMKGKIVRKLPKSSPKDHSNYKSEEFQEKKYSQFSQMGENQSEIQTHIQTKKYDSAAIFRRNNKPISSKKKVVESSTHNNEPMLYSFGKSDIPKIFIPQLNIIPQPGHCSQELIEIGLITFEKFGYHINDSRMLKVKKYRNCVQFSINNELSILWHYEGKFFIGSEKQNTNGESQREGEGIEFLPGKYKFKGIFHKGKRNGFGVQIMDTGSIYIGQWVDGFKQGKGKEINEEKYIYEGQWKFGKKNGNGKISFEDSLIFQGNFTNGLKNGFGKQFFKNGDTYEGDYLNDKFNGKGIYKWKQGAIYRGDFINGERNGNGIWKSDEIEGHIYEGQYKSNKKHGYGIYKWPNGSTYEGSFKNDLKHGQGKLQYQDGKISHLHWENGQVVNKIIQSQILKKKQKPALSEEKKFVLRKSTQMLRSTNPRNELSAPKSLKQKKNIDGNKVSARLSHRETKIKLKVDEYKDGNKIMYNSVANEKGRMQTSKLRR